MLLVRSRAERQEQKKWHISQLPVLFISDQRIFIYLYDLAFCIVSDQEPKQSLIFGNGCAGDDWRFRRTLKDLHLDDAGTLIFCLSPLDGKMAMPYMTVQVVPERAVFCGSRKKRQMICLRSS